MKRCPDCSSEHTQPRSMCCIKCQRRLAMKKYCEKNRGKLTAYAKTYREKNRDLTRKRSKRSREEKIELYKQRALERFIKKRGLPLDYKPWKRKAGEGNITKCGYKVITIKEKNHPNAFDSKRRMHEHTYVMVNFLGRPLHKGETVHHKNGDRLDNRIENLELWHRSHPPGQRVEDKIKWCKEFLEIYGYKITLSDP